MKAGKIDGAGAFLRFRVVVLPFIRYALLITAVINTLLAATSLDLLFLLTTGGPGKSTYTLTYYVYDVTMTRLDIGYGAAASFLLIAVIMLITAVYFVGLRAWELWRR